MEGEEIQDIEGTDDCDTVGSNDNVSGLGSFATRHVLSQGAAKDEVDWELETRDRPGGAQRGGSSSHVGPTSASSQSVFETWR